MNECLITHETLGFTSTSLLFTKRRKNSLLLCFLCISLHRCRESVSVLNISAPYRKFWPFRSRALPSLSVWTVRLTNIRVVWPVKTKRSIGESVLRGRRAPAAPCETLALLRPSPLAGPFSLRRPRTKRGPKQWLALRAEWRCRSSTNPLPLWQKQNPHLFWWREANPPCKEVMNTAWALNIYIYKKRKYRERNRHWRQMMSNGARKEPVLHPVSPLFITDQVYTIQASARFSARNLTFASSCRLYLHLQALLIFPYFLHLAVQAHLWRCGEQRRWAAEGENVLVDYLLGKLDGQLPQEPVFYK